MVLRKSLGFLFVAFVFGSAIWRLYHLQVLSILLCLMYEEWDTLLVGQNFNAVKPPTCLHPL
jgi:hypothetical protein